MFRLFLATTIVTIASCQYGNQGAGSNYGSQQGQGYQSPSGGNYGSQAAQSGNYGNQAPSSGSFGNQAAPAASYGNQAATTSNFGNQAASSANYGNQAATSGSFGSQAAPAGNYGNQAAPASNFGNQAAPASNFGNQAAPVSNFGVQAAPATNFGNQAVPPSNFGNQPSVNLGNQQNQGFSAQSNENNPQGEGMPYEFSWFVKDDPSQNDYSHNEKSDGQVVTGSYSVLLPDGRTQIVTYRVEGDSGFVADVKYEGEIRPDAFSQRPSAQGGPQPSEASRLPQPPSPPVNFVQQQTAVSNGFSQQNSQSAASSSYNTQGSQSVGALGNFAPKPQTYQQASSSATRPDSTPANFAQQQSNSGYSQQNLQSAAPAGFNPQGPTNAGNTNGFTPQTQTAQTYATGQVTKVSPNVNFNSANQNNGYAKATGFASQVQSQAQGEQGFGGAKQTQAYNQAVNNFSPEGPATQNFNSPQQGKNYQGYDAQNSGQRSYRHIDLTKDAYIGEGTFGRRIGGRKLVKLF
ncbi:pro-resilin-like [Artemia franciscana]|uniref:Cuticle protein n=1 Tax=Artemia franciscana TaxID=6661 RepID=A0AA88H9J8_ARTSF|nr:hypothetical protein QYM36_015209 [Artemia franciscana]